MFIKRPRLVAELASGLEQFRAVALLGARQVGKTTLVDIYQKNHLVAHHFDLESERDRAALAVSPQTTLAALQGTVVIDEIQQMPELFRMLRPLTDRRPLPAKFILLGSASPPLVRGISESLAGRCLYLHVPGFSLEEVGHANQETLWSRGGFPDSYLATDDARSVRWRRSLIASILERDMPQLGITVPAATLRRFWMMIAHYHGQIWNASEIARSMDVSYKAAQHYRDLLCGTFMLRSLQPWYENLGKRLVKSPKIYIRDSGLLHALLELQTMDAVRMHPAYGASWEGFALEQTLTALGEEDAYFYSTIRGAELDLMLLRHGRRWGFEFKCTDAPKMTKSLHVALADLKLEKAWIVYPGNLRYPVHQRVEALPLTSIGGIAGEMQRIIAGT